LWSGVTLGADATAYRAAVTGDFAMVLATVASAVFAGVSAVTTVLTLLRRPPRRQVRYYLDRSRRYLPDVPAGDIVAPAPRNADGTMTTRVRIVNTGRASLPTSDWDGPLEIHVSGSRLVSASQSGAGPRGLRVNVSVTTDRVVVDPFLFNSRDMVEITVVTADPAEISVHTRIRDIRRVARKRYVYPPGTGVDGALTLGDKLMTFVAFPAMFSVVLILILLRGAPDVHLPAVLMFTGVLVAFEGFVANAVRRSRLWRPE
jgi:hypothetical protein